MFEKISMIQDTEKVQTLVEEINQLLTDVKKHLIPPLQQIRSVHPKISMESNGLKAKTVLFIGYCSYIVFFLLLKFGGQSINKHPAILRLIQFRNYLDKTFYSNGKGNHMSEQAITASDTPISISNEKNTKQVLVDENKIRLKMSPKKYPFCETPTSTHSYVKRFDRKRNDVSQVSNLTKTNILKAIQNNFNIHNKTDYFLSVKEKCNSSISLSKNKANEKINCEKKEDWIGTLSSLNLMQVNVEFNKKTNKDEFYKSVKAAGAVIKENKKRLLKVPSFSPMSELGTSTFTTRKISLDILKNRGLSRYRNNKIKNPRKKNRIRFKNVKIKCNGQIQVIRS
jgi:hypothetical protein